MRQWSILTALAALVVLAAGFMLLVKPARHHASSLRKQAVSAEQGNQMLVQQLRILRDEARDEPKDQAQLAAVAAKIPGNPGLPSLIRSLSSAADDSGVELVSITPSQPTLATLQSIGPGSTGAAASSTSSSPASSARPAVAAGPQLAQISVQLQVNCPFFQCEQFVSALESLNRAYLVTGFTVQPMGGTGSSSTSSSSATSSATAGGGAAATAPPGQLNMTITGDVFMSVPQAAGTANGGSVTTSPAQPAK